LRNGSPFVSLDQDLTVKGGILDGGTISGKGKLTVEGGTFSWFQGVISASSNHVDLVVKADATLAISARAAATRLYLTNRSLENHGTVTLNRGNLRMTGTARIHNYGTFSSISTDWVTISTDAIPTDPRRLKNPVHTRSFYNAGTLYVDGKGTSTKKLIMLVPYQDQDDAKIVVSSGTLAFFAGSDSYGKVSLGLRNGKPRLQDATVYFGVATSLSRDIDYYWNKSVAFDGSGTIELTSRAPPGGKRFDPNVRIVPGISVTIPTDIELVANGGAIGGQSNGPGGTLNLKGIAHFNGTKLFDGVTTKVDGGALYIQEWASNAIQTLPGLYSNAKLINDRGIIDLSGKIDFLMGQDTEIDLLNGGQMKFDGPINIKPDRGTTGAKIINKGLCALCDSHVTLARVIGRGIRLRV
jgi:hypothetical protein